MDMCKDIFFWTVIYTILLTNAIILTNISMNLTWILTPFNIGIEQMDSVKLGEFFFFFWGGDWFENSSDELGSHEDDVGKVS